MYKRQITNSAQVEQGTSHTVAWEVTEPGYVIRDILVDGASRPDLISPDGKGSVSFDGVSEEHSVTVIVGKQAETDMDVDGDGIPDVNLSLIHI